MIDRTTVFGNPFSEKEYGRELCIELFAIYFYDRMVNDKYFCFKVETELKDKILGCWCKPQACHGDIIAAYLDGTNDAEW